MVTSVDVYKEIRRLQLEGVTSQRRAATLLGISRNTVKKYWEGNAVPWERQTYEREAAVLTPPGGSTTDWSRNAALPAVSPRSGKQFIS